MVSTPHYLVDVRQADIKRGATVSVYLLLWAMTPDPFAVSPTLQTTIKEIEQTLGASYPTIRAALTQLEQDGLLEVSVRPGYAHVYKLHRPKDSIGREIDGPFTRDAFLAAAIQQPIETSIRKRIRLVTDEPDDT